MMEPKSPKLQTETPAAKLPRYETDFSRCIICQKESPRDLVDNPISHEKLLNSITERAKYGDKEFVHVSKRLENVTYNDLQDRSATWHRKCYQDAVHLGMCKRAKERYEKQIETQRLGRKSPLLDQPKTSNFTCSQSVPFDKNLCFFL